MLHLKSDSEIEKIRDAGRIAAEAMLRVKEIVRIGCTTNELDAVAAQYIKSQGAIASALNYRGYPKSICVSTNNEIVHGIPGPRKLLNGDIISVDIAVNKNGFHGDMNATMLVGQVEEETQRLVESTRTCLELGLAASTADNRLGDIGSSIQSYAEQCGFSVVREYCGHGIGREFHEEPQLLHYGATHTGRRLQIGMVFTIEPMINAGKKETRLLDDSWTAVTADGSLSAQFEHTVAVTSKGPDILTRFEDLPF
ncbi:MAG: type I methionyl aminopeptidase [Candidatus Latescibacterota bacterium]|nr:type I methionyl aminopeptidase [Candidatus Latescibacterota bacterium]